MTDHDRAALLALGVHPDRITAEVLALVGADAHRPAAEAAARQRAAAQRPDYPISVGELIAAEEAQQRRNQRTGAPS